MMLGEEVRPIVYEKNFCDLEAIIKYDRLRIVVRSDIIGRVVLQKLQLS